MSFTEFRKSPKGDRIGAILRSSIAGMEDFSELGRPALLAAVPQIAAAGVALSNTEKQHVGRWVHRLLGPRGWRVADKKRLPKGCLFTTAAVYERADGEPPPAEPRRVLRAAASTGGAAARLAAARRRVRALPSKPQSVAELIAEKRRAAARGE